MTYPPSSNTSNTTEGRNPTSDPHPPKRGSVEGRKHTSNPIPSNDIAYRLQARTTLRQTIIANGNSCPEATSRLCHGGQSQDPKRSRIAAQAAITLRFSIRIRFIFHIRFFVFVSIGCLSMHKQTYCRHKRPPTVLHLGNPLVYPKQSLSMRKTTPTKTAFKYH